MHGYTWFGNNRKNLSKRASRGSGGVGMLIKNSVLKELDVAVLENKFEGLLWIQLIHKVSKQQMGICVGYLPASNSSRGNQSQEFFDTLKSLIIDNYHLGPFLIYGDFNVRCGNRPNITSDSVPERAAIDLTVNQAGREL